MEINGCIIHTKIPLSRSEQVFYLFNSVTKINVRFPVLGVGDREGDPDGVDTASGSGLVPDGLRPTLREEGDFFRPNPDIKMLEHKKAISSYEDQGFYQCGVTIRSGPYGQKTILSNSVDVQFVGK